MPDFPDHSIVEKAVAGDALAFRQLVERHQVFVHRVAYRLVGTTSDAEDITQEAFIRLWKNLSRYKPEIRMTTWLYKIVTNLCLDFLKSRRRKMAKMTADIREDNVHIHTSPADQGMVDEELRLALEEFSSALSPKQKAVFVLRDLEDVEMKEIGEILSMAPGQVKSNLYYARKRMAELIAIRYQTEKR